MFINGIFTHLLTSIYQKIKFVEQPNLKLKLITLRISNYIIAYAKLILDSYDEEVPRIQRLKRFNNPFVFANGILLAAFEEANEAVIV